MKVNCRTITLTDAVIQVLDRVTCLGVVIDSQLTFADNVKKLAGSCFYQLRQLCAVRRSLTTDAATTLVHTLISSRVDYCNSVLYGMCEVYLRPLQSVLNAAARLITDKRKFDHITSTIRDDLHWLPVRQRIVFKLCSIVSKCLRRTAPSYLADLCTCVSATTALTRLRSSSHGDLIIPRSRLSRYGSRSFAVCGPAAWNSLPVAVQDLSSSASSFCRHLKTELFSRAYGVFPP